MSWQNTKCRQASRRLGDYDWLLTADKKLYPTDRPVTLESLGQWYQRNPEFAFFCGGRDGVCASIPLSRKGWEKLVAGAVAESELESAHIFDNTRDQAIAIHVYHIERDPQSKSGFYLHALEKLGRVVEELKTTNPHLAVCGFSGFCVTNQSIGLFKNRLSCRESRLVSTEHIMRKNAQLFVFDLQSDIALTAKISEGYELMNRCQMLVTSPGDESIVWRFLSPASAGDSRHASAKA